MWVVPKKCNGILECSSALIKYLSKEIFRSHFNSRIPSFGKIQSSANTNQMNVGERNYIFAPISIEAEQEKKVLFAKFFFKFYENYDC